MKTHNYKYLLLVITLFLFQQPGKTEVSDLYGADGELRTDFSRIPDFSYTGYREGEVPIPKVPTVANVKDFGAIGNGVADDTQAFLDAIKKTKNGAIFIPEGTYVITQILKIQKSNLVLRGAGKDKSILYFPKSCREVSDENFHGKGGFLWVEGKRQQSDNLANITSNAVRGDRFLDVNSTDNLSVGQRIEISMSLRKNNILNNALVNHLYGGDPGDVSILRGEPWQMFEIVSLTKNRIELDRPLFFNAQSNWSPKIRTVNYSVNEFGIEDLGLEMARDQYDGHFEEEWNGIYFLDISNSWIKNVHIHFADEAFLIKGRFCTLDNVSYDAPTGKNGADFGHNGIFVDRPGGYNLIKNFQANATYMHSLAVRGSSGNVFSKGTGVRIDFDMAAHCPFSNLYTEIEITQPNLIWKGSGTPGSGKSAAAWNTLWNIKADSSISYPKKNTWSKMINVIGVTSNQKSKKNPDADWFEVIDPDNLIPQNLYEHQLKKRLSDEGGGNGPDNKAPTVSFDPTASTLELEEGYSSINIVAIANDEDGSIANVKLYLDEILVGQDKNPKYKWLGSKEPELLGLGAGTYQLTLIATDDDGAMSNNAMAELTITAAVGNMPPTVQFNNNKSTLELTEGYSTILIRANALDIDGSIDYVQLYLGDDLIGEDYTAVYKWNQNTNRELLGLAAGTYELTLIATDNKRATAQAVTNMTVSMTAKTPYQIWEKENGLATDSGDLDTDNDGYSNKYEFLFALDPNNPLNPRKAQVYVDEQGHLNKTYTRRKDQSITYTVEISTDLIPGSWASLGNEEYTITTSSADNGDGTETLTIMYKPALKDIADKLFFRIKASE
ncbi:MAG: Ig-like domain-containing protein [Verrucomicrobiota bacterium]